MGEEGISICRVRFWWCLCYEVKVKGTAQRTYRRGSSAAAVVRAELEPIM